MTTLTALNALSPLDGRYGAKLDALRPLMSEYGFMHRRVQVELAWFEALGDAGLSEFAPLNAEERAHAPAIHAALQLCREKLQAGFGPDAALQ